MARDEKAHFIRAEARFSDVNGRIGAFDGELHAVRQQLMSRITAEANASLEHFVEVRQIMSDFQAQLQDLLYMRAPTDYDTGAPQPYMAAADTPYGSSQARPNEREEGERRKEGRKKGEGGRMNKKHGFCFDFSRPRLPLYYSSPFSYSFQGQAMFGGQHFGYNDVEEEEEEDDEEYDDDDPETRAAHAAAEAAFEASFRESPSDLPEEEAEEQDDSLPASLKEQPAEESTMEFAPSPESAEHASNDDVDGADGAEGAEGGDSAEDAEGDGGAQGDDGDEPNSSDGHLDRTPREQTEGSVRSAARSSGSNDEDD